MPLPARERTFSLPPADTETEVEADPASITYESPEKRLLSAILEDGICTLLQNYGKRGGYSRKAVDETVAWFSSTDDEPSAVYFPFVQVCQELRVDPKKIRRGLEARLLWIDQNPGERVRVRNGPERRKPSRKKGRPRKI